MLTSAPPRRAVAARGFTLIELMVAIAMVAVLLKLGVPSLVAWMRNGQVRTVTEALSNGVRLAQTEAVRRNRTVVLSLVNAQPALNATAVANGPYWSMQTISQFGDGGAAFIQGGALTDVASGVTVTGPAAICFNSNGRLAAVASTTTGVGAACTVADRSYDVAMSGGDRPLRVTVGLSGQVRLCDPNRPARSDTAPDGC